MEWEGGGIGMKGVGGGRERGSKLMAECQDQDFKSHQALVVTFCYITGNGTGVYQQSL